MRYNWETFHPSEVQFQMSVSVFPKDFYIGSIDNLNPYISQHLMQELPWNQQFICVLDNSFVSFEY